MFVLAALPVLGGGWVWGEILKGFIRNAGKIRTRYIQSNKYSKRLISFRSSTKRFDTLSSPEFLFCLILCLIRGIVRSSQE